MQTDNRFLDDLARIASGAVGTLQGVKTEIDGLVRREMERLLSGMELVRRDEFEAVKAMAAAARLENERLAARIVELEARLGAASNPENSAPRG
jgi:BMFP domain-containing protein YqiC